LKLNPFQQEAKKKEPGANTDMAKKLSENAGD